MILVDSPKRYETKLRHKVWSHMVSTVSADELHQMADMLGLKREWWQQESFSHYDITPPKRLKALKLGAIQVSPRAICFCNYDYANKRRVRPCDHCAAILGQPARVLGIDVSPLFVHGCPKCDLSLYLPDRIVRPL